MMDIDLQPTLIGKTITLRPLLPEDFSALYEAAADPVLWEMHPDTSRYQRDVFEQRFFVGAIASGGAFAVVANDTGRVVGSSRFYDWDPKLREIAIGYTFIERALWGSGANAEMKQLMLNHIFAYAQIVWFHIAEGNFRSRRAVEKLGAILTYQEDDEVEGKTFVKLYYKLGASSYRG
jgi:N-acetyltransferase